MSSAGVDAAHLDPLGPVGLARERLDLLAAVAAQQQEAAVALGGVDADHVPEDRVPADLHERLGDLGAVLLQPRPATATEDRDEHLRQATRHGRRRNAPRGRTPTRASGDEIVDLVPERARRVLDLGCSTGWLAAALKERGPVEVVGIEREPAYAADRARSAATASWSATSRTSRATSAASTASSPPTCSSTSSTRGARSRATRGCSSPAAAR